MQAQQKKIKALPVFLISIFIAIVTFEIARAEKGYNRAKATAYAQSYAYRYPSDGWFFRYCSGAPAEVFGGAPLSSQNPDDEHGGCDCSHFVSCAIGGLGFKTYLRTPKA
jgi:hypothetical protein